MKVQLPQPQKFLLMTALPQLHKPPTPPIKGHSVIFKGILDGYQCYSKQTYITVKMQTHFMPCSYSMYRYLKKKRSASLPPKTERSGT